MGLFGFGIFAGMIIAMILICVWGIFRKDDKGTNKDILHGYNDMGVSSIDTTREYRGNNNYDSRKSQTDEDEIDEIIEDLFIFNILGIL